jgi:zinc protease
MVKRTLSTLCVLALLATNAFAQATKPGDLKYPPLPEFKVAKPTRFVLDNGLVVMVMEDHELPLVNVVA